jgi:hypothetical protein
MGWPLPDYVGEEFEASLKCCRLEFIQVLGDSANRIVWTMVLAYLPNHRARPSSSGSEIK